MKRSLAIVFVLLLISPGLWWAFNRARGNGDNTITQGFPLPTREDLLDRDYYQAIERWFSDTLPSTKTLKIVNNWLNFKLFSSSSNPLIHVGIHGWLFSTAAARHDDDPSPVEQGRRLLLTLHAAENIINAAGSRFMVTVVPTKAAIYPEFAGTRADDLRSPIYRALIAANRQHPLTGLVQLEPALIKAKMNDTAVFDQQARIWNCKGAAAAAGQILHAGKPPLSTVRMPADGDCGPPDAALYRRLLGQVELDDEPSSGHAAGPFLIGGPVATIYADEWLNPILPFLSPAFGALHVIDAHQTPTAGRNLLERASDLVLIEVAAEHLHRLHLDIESIYSAAANDLTGTIEHPMDLARARAVKDCILTWTPPGLEIRSSGSTSRFTLPPVSGSTSAIFRMVKLTFSKAHHGAVTVRYDPPVTALREKLLSRETRFVLVPLPIEETVTLSVNPSASPGVFLLEAASLISFYGDHGPAGKTTRSPRMPIGDLHSELEIRPISPPPAIPAEPPAIIPAPHPTPPQPALTLNDIAAGRIFQRRGQSADIVVSGTYAGVAGPVEARVVSARRGTVRVPWTVVDDAPENGVFTGILSQVPQGGWYRLQIRSRLAPWIVATGENRWGVGMLVACIGQSNMREWFATGEDLTPSTQLMIHRNGDWHRPTRTGNGALALGNRLAAELGIPIGLLDYSVNGSGLTAKADWGVGFWRNTAPESIYRQFIDGVHRVGGAVEAVVWMQGEADAARGTISREAYQLALQRFVDHQLRIDIENGSTRPLLPFLMIPLVKRPTGKDRPCQWIRQAQMDALTTIAECYLAATSIDLKNRGRQHLAAEGYTTLGLRTAQTVLYLAGKVDYHRGPTIVAVTRTSKATIDVTIRHRGGNDFAPSAGITGFSVVTEDRTLGVTSAVRTDATTIRLQMAAPLPDRFRVRYLYGAHPDTSGAVHDDTELALPLDPYEG